MRNAWFLQLTCGAVVAGTVACGSASPSAAGTDAASGATGEVAAAADSAATADAAKAAQDAATPAADVAAKPDTASTKPPCKPWDSPSDWNCPNGSHCAYDDNDAIACVKDGAHGMGEDCGDGGGCKIGICVTSQNGSQACSPFCTTEVQCDSNSCNQINGKKYKVCDVAKYTACQPINAKCPASQGCYLLGSQGFVCVAAGSKGKGESCKANYECAPGYTCTGISDTSTSTGLCRKVCSTGGGPTGCLDPTTPCSKLAMGYGYCEE